jgi:hypothetical protein
MPQFSRCRYEKCHSHKHKLRLPAGARFCSAACQKAHADAESVKPLRPLEIKVLETINNNSTTTSLLMVAAALGAYHPNPDRSKAIETKYRNEAKKVVGPHLTTLVNRGLVVDCGGQRYCPSAWVAR